MKMNRQHGFTLIEVIAALMLAGILAASVMISLAPVAEGLMQVKVNADIAHKARLAMTRLVRELTTATNFTATGSSSLDYRFLTPSGDHRFEVRDHDVRWSGVAGEALMLEGWPLLDRVEDFQIAPAGSSPEVFQLSFRLGNGTGVDDYEMRVVPRNMPEGEVAP